MLGVKYCRRPAMAEVVSATKIKITECLMLSGREAAHSTWKLSSTLLIRLEVVCEWVPASVLRVSVCFCSAHPLVCPPSCNVHSRGRDLDCSRASTTLPKLETRWRNHPELQNALLLTFTYTKEKNIRI